MIQFAVFNTHCWDNAVIHRIPPSDISRNKSIVHRKQTNDNLNTARRAGRMSRKGFSAGYLWHVILKNAFQCSTFCLVIIGGSCSMSIYIVNLFGGKMSHFQRIFHCKESPLAVI